MALVHSQTSTKTKVENGKVTNTRTTVKRFLGIEIGREVSTDTYPTPASVQTAVQTAGTKTPTPPPPGGAAALPG